MQSKKITFTNSDGKKLSARIEFPLKSDPLAYAIFAHCFTCNKNLNAVRNISRSLSNEGIAVFSFDFTGLGESEGDFPDTNFSSNVQDLIDASEYLKKEYEAPTVLLGHSLGGAAVIHAAARIPEIKALITIGAPAGALHVEQHFSGKVKEIEAEGIAEVNIGGRPFSIKKQFLDDLRSDKTLSVVSDLKKPLLIMHAPFDEIVGIDNAAKIYSEAKHPKNFISLDGADHLLSNKEDAHFAGRMIGGWVSRYTEPEKDKMALKTDLQVVVRTGKSFTTEIQTGIHHLTADEPVEVGGNNYGPSPYDLLLSALGACSAMTLRMYANRKKWDLKEVTVHLKHGKEYVEDSKHSGEEQSKIDIIRKLIEIEGDLSEEQRQRLFEIAGRCPVHKTLLSDIHIESELK